VFDTLEDPKKSVYQWLASNKDFTKITKLINFDPEVKKLLDGASHGLTVLAPNNAALPSKPHKDIDSIRPHDSDAMHQLCQHVERHDDDHDHDHGDKDRERRRRILKAILHKVLLYHVLPFDLTSTNLGFNSTVHTAIQPSDGSFHDQPYRIKIERTLVPPGIKINHYAKIIETDIRATNGIIHVLGHPLFPPASVLDNAHLGPAWLSTTTSAVQKVNLESALEWRYVPGPRGRKGSFHGNPTVTLFAPTNDAWAKLPEHLIFYLFSPFGASALRKVLQYHVIPEFLVYTEWVHSAKGGRKQPNGPGGEEDLTTMGSEIDFAFPFKTALRGHTLGVTIKKTTPIVPIPGVSSIELTAGGVVATIYDLPANNGVLHIIPEVLDPRGKKEGEGAWEDWEEWLPQWADEA